MVQTMLPKSWRAMKFYFTTVYQEIWVGVALTAYAYYKISYGIALKGSSFSHKFYKGVSNNMPILNEEN
uniref:Uncharacterized protein n=1 Tax=Calidris pygmaea TaxID=425635 RepID=A0A8C3J3Z0_9CHAR